LTGVTREILPMIMPDGDNSLPNVLLRTGGTKSKFIQTSVTVNGMCENCECEYSSLQSLV